jgi:N-acetylmuramoyl-L-alanine amidase
MDQDSPLLAPLNRRRAIGLSIGAAVAAVTALQPETASAANFSRVVIDPGHGGRDPGSRWYGISEKTLTLDVAKRLSTVLKAKKISTVLTRTGDTSLSLDDRAKKSNLYSDALLVSIHFNAHTNRSVKGIETFYYPGSTKGRLIATKVQKELGNRINTANRGIKAGRMKVLRLTKHPSVLIECSFLSNRWECQRCAASWYRQIIAEEIAEGLMNYR